MTEIHDKPLMKAGFTTEADSEVGGALVTHWLVSLLGATMNNGLITDVADPVNGTDGANKAYVDYATGAPIWTFITGPAAPLSGQIKFDGGATFDVSIYDYNGVYRLPEFYNLSVGDQICLRTSLDGQYFVVTVQSLTAFSTYVSIAASSIDGSGDLEGRQVFFEFMPVSRIYADVAYKIAPGSIMVFAGPTIPDGWLACDGQAVSRIQYSDLYLAIGATYGMGNGLNTFNLPSMKSMIGVGDSFVVQPHIIKY